MPGLKVLFAFAFYIVFWGFAPAFAGGPAKVMAAAGQFKPSSPIDYKVEKVIFSILKSNQPGAELPSVEDIRVLLDFMMVCQGRGADVNPEKYAGGTGVFWRESVNKPLAQVLRYLYNPGIAQEILYPSSIRANRIMPDSGVNKLPRPLWEYLDEIEDPLFFWSREWEEITPDDFSGSYYSYDLDRLIILFKYLDKPMVMTVSWQDGESEVGRKGGFLGPYENWDFVYSNEQGATASGLGWAKTYMYTSAMITLMYPEGDNDEGTGYALFKWLKAGWSGLNVVQAKHIISGADRIFAGFNTVMGAESSPSPERLEEMVCRIRAMDEETLIAASQAYCDALAEASLADPVLSGEEFQSVLAGGNYARGLSRERLEALALINELKRLLGKPVLGDPPQPVE